MFSGLCSSMGFQHLSVSPSIFEMENAYYISQKKQEGILHMPNWDLLYHLEIASLQKTVQSLILLPLKFHF